MPKKYLLIISSCILCCLGIFIAFLYKHNQKDGSEKEVFTVSEQTAKQNFSSLINMNKWLYNEQDQVYYQLGIIYTRNPSDTIYQKLALFVPKKYLRCQENDDNTHFCETNMASRIEQYTVRNAPFVFEINSPLYANTPALNEYQDYTQYTNRGVIYLHIGFRGLEYGAPAAITDLKAAIRFIKYNSERIPGNREAIYAFGNNYGGALATILGSSGNSNMYTPYLQEIGALENIDDNLTGVAIYNPTNAPDTANEAYEWNYGHLRPNMSKSQKKISQKMAKEYADYINRAGFLGQNGRALTLQHSQRGIYQSGSYYDYIKKVVEQSFDNFLRNTNFPYSIPKSWLADSGNQSIIKLSNVYKNKDKLIEDLNSRKKWISFSSVSSQIIISDLNIFNLIFKNQFKPLASFDGLNRQQTENILFAIQNGDNLHFDPLMANILKNTEHAKNFSADLYKRDNKGYTTTKRVNMYNPFYYLLPSSEGYKTSTVAPYWNINMGVFQTDTPLTAAINLYLALSNYGGINIKFNAVWGVGNISDNISENQINSMIDWLNSTQRSN